MKLLKLAIPALALLSACNSGEKGTTLADADSAAIKAIDEQGFDQYLSVLASDDFQGRKPFTVGETKTINYLQEEFKKLGLEPGNGDSYFQEVPLVDIKAIPGQMTIAGAKGKITLNHLDDFVGASRRVRPQVNIKESPMIFAGYGIVAPEYNWNDYEGLDVKGKTVVVLVNDPGFNDSTLFRGKNMTYYGRWTYKFEEASRQGATGVIIIHDTAPASYPWTVVRSGWSKSRLHLDAKNDNMDRTALEGWITREQALKMFALAGKSPDLMKEAGKKGFKPVDLGLTTSVDISYEIKRSVSNNVVAVLPGTERKDEYIIYSAHWDHLGVGEAIQGDSIYNGAVDNAVGTAALLELAKAYKASKTKPARSVMFLAVTAEEQGLLGSEYYATHPLVPVNKTVANINMDAIRPLGRMKDVIVRGYGQSELDEYAEEAAKKQGRVVVKDPDPSAGLFFRSDHFNFAKVGIPALYIGGGINSVKNGEAWGKEQVAEYTKNRYHQPADNYDRATWDLSGVVDDVRFLFGIGWRLSNETTWPKWKEGSEFKAARDKSMK